MNKRLFLNAIVRYFLGLILVGLLLFVPAGTLNYWNAWLFMGLLFIPMFIAGIILMFKNPILALVLFMISYILYAEVLRENTYLSRTIKVQKNQKVVDTGLYSIVRHPMYSVTIILFLTMPLILGSIISFIIFLIYPFIIFKRIDNEERVLEKELKGYKEYKRKVKYRLIPFVW